jgi:metal-responsive CopG/Arc/MetJ family transcriptional regulator
MKTAVSIADELFERVERFARRSRTSRSEVFSAALEEYISRHEPDEVTEALNEVCDRLGNRHDDFVAVAGSRILERAKW